MAVARAVLCTVNINPAMSEVIALQPAAIVDHVALLNDDSISTFVGAAEMGGSRRVDTTELKGLLSSVPGDVHELVTGQAGSAVADAAYLMLRLLIEFNTKAGGSAANVARSLAGAFGVAAGLVSQPPSAYLKSGEHMEPQHSPLDHTSLRCLPIQVGACGDDEWGDLFLNSLRRAGVATDRVRCLPGPTGRAVILTSRTSGQRTMRTNLVSTHSLTSDMLEDKDFRGSQWWELLAAQSISGTCIELYQTLQQSSVAHSGSALSQLRANLAILRACRPPGCS